MESRDTVLGAQIACSLRFSFDTMEMGVHLLVNEGKLNLTIKSAAMVWKKTSWTLSVSSSTPGHSREECSHISRTFAPPVTALSIKSGSMIVECLPFSNETVQVSFGLQTAATSWCMPSVHVVAVFSYLPFSLKHLASNRMRTLFRSYCESVPFIVLYPPQNSGVRHMFCHLSYHQSTVFACFYCSLRDSFETLKLHSKCQCRRFPSFW
ncbi:uncharacterized protein HD556DRAFT_117690 [Suillus plorans]|uniref:Uncharacterized protein n=1 Tax=Suillus plorans TaxID=116603 RepID=A0A9P7J1D5_9AGAM|nr:uncharacterized protein HD556DRAFT_117690 [Suillus plorans]KAG1799273.1 hypothetical protein HD556DRAFT_117690 [Suillus plorans]